MYSPRRRPLRALLALVLLTGVVALVAQLAGVSGSGGPRAGVALDFDGGHERWLVQAPRDAAASVEVAARSLGGERTGSKLADDWYEVVLDEELIAADVESALGEAGAVDIEPVLPRFPYDAARLGDQWALTQASDVDLDAPEAWARTKGSGVIVAVIDTGVDKQHPDLIGRVLDGRDFSGASTPATTDVVGHGTQVASIIAGNGTTISGVAPEAMILPLKVFRDSAGNFSMSGYVAAIRYAVDQGADVINISLGCGGTAACFSQAELDALAYATEHGAIVVAASGNGDNTGRGMNNDSAATPDYPSGYELPGIVSVTSHTRSGAWSPWANYGATTVDLAAPGEGILVAAANSRGHKTVSGTSFAAPHASGVAALVAAAQPGIAPTDAYARIMGSLVAAPTLAGRTVGGGMINADAAVLGAQTVAAGGGGAAAGAGSAPVTRPTPVKPKRGARMQAPPVLSWKLPPGWRSQRVQITGPGVRINERVPASRRAMAHPRAAWRSGTYRWKVIARTPAGASRATTRSSYRMASRVGAWVSSGRLRSGGRAARLRVGYAATSSSARVRVRILRGRTVLHSGRWTKHREHVRGRGTPRRGWFSYDAKLRGGALRVGTRVTVEVRVSSRGASTTRRFKAAVR